MKRRKLLVFSTSNVDDLEDFFYVDAKYQSLLNHILNLLKHKQFNLQFSGDFPKKDLVTLGLCK